MTSAPKNYIGEWFGRRLFPTVLVNASDLAEIREKKCPFLTKALGTEQKCIKPANASGVCTVTTRKGGVRDWIVCPYRALDPHGLQPIVRALFPNSDVRSDVIAPVTTLQSRTFIRSVSESDAKKAFIYFSEKIGGELSIPKSSRSPELSFDVVVFDCTIDEGAVIVGEFGVYEVQTMDFHGSYRHAVTALISALNLHHDRFPKALSENIEWAGRGIEGPNISNVFKRTFYQMALKFELARQESCSGVVLGLPEAVWESWAHHLALPKVVSRQERFELEGTDASDCGNSWIATLVSEQTSSSIQPLTVDKFIRVSANDLIKRAFVDVSEHIGTATMPVLRHRAVQRMRQLVSPGVRVD